MGQENPFLPALNSSNKLTPLTVDANGALNTVLEAGIGVYNITTTTTLKASPGRVLVVSVIVAGTAAGGIYDTASSPSSEIFTIPVGVAIYQLNLKAQVGITVIPGTGQVLAILYE